MTLLSTPEFLKSASTLFEDSQKTHSSIYITQKRYIEHNEVEGTAALYNEISQFSNVKPTLPNSSIITNSTNQYPILIRITNGDSDKLKKVKLSTIVKPEELAKFWKDYSTVIKSGAKGLKKKEKKAKKASKKVSK
ncbi:hypothetical protein WICPIJ_010023 [Wickerhamomyces pijperi]|uniref:Signal recognition particle subunit SRP14 n=1 Tax=Wickerhamomyces pijperi TaxID=599730 RepID=A0A9P8PI39_WICPI|nr:hypothetical protein WICPIJ_010023 [Wickerhamomyces pijperi]